MVKPAFIVTQIVLSILTAGLVHAEPAKPNVIFIAIDDLNDETKMMDYKTAGWAAEQLKTRDFEGKPFFMAIGISKPHLTWYVPQKYFEMYPLDEIVLPKTLATDRPANRRAQITRES